MADCLWIVAAPSCVGKSSFIESDIAFRLTGLPARKYVQADRYMKGSRLRGSYYLHLGLTFRSGTIFDDLQNVVNKQAVILIVPKSTHVQRIIQRDLDSIKGLAPAIPKGYLNNMSKISPLRYLELYQLGLERLRNCGASCSIRRADRHNYPLVTESELLTILEED